MDPPVMAARAESIDLRPTTADRAAGVWWAGRPGQVPAGERVGMQAGGSGPDRRGWIRRPRSSGSDNRVLAFSALAMTMTVYGQTPGVAVFVNAVIADLG